MLHPQPRTSDLSPGHLWSSTKAVPLTLGSPPTHDASPEPRPPPKRGLRSRHSHPQKCRAREQQSDSSDQEQEPPEQVSCSKHSRPQRYRIPEQQSDSSDQEQKSPERVSRSKHSRPRRRRAPEQQPDSLEQERQPLERGPHPRHSKRSRSQRPRSLDRRSRSPQRRSPSLDPPEVHHVRAHVRLTRRQLPTPPSTQPTRATSTTHGPLQRKRATAPATDSEQPLSAPVTSHPPRSIGSAEWVPTHTPSWVLGDDHTAHIHSAAPFLLAVPGGREWQRLLKHYVRFEGLSPSIDVSA
jgi:hypothetical protein